MNSIKIVCISDTHTMHSYHVLQDHIRKIGPADILIHAGDFTAKGRNYEIEDFSKWMSGWNKQFKHIVGIAGNHEVTLDKTARDYNAYYKNHLFGFTYLESEGIELEGYKIWGSPVSPFFNNWAFSRFPGEDIRKEWDKIPNDTEILITHSPVAGILDIFPKKDVPENNYPDHKPGDLVSAGCEELYKAIMRIKPKLHVCGHIHHSHGIFKTNDTTFVNASICTEEYKPYNMPIVVELPRK